MGLVSSLSSSDKVALDTNLFILAYGKKDFLSDLARDFLDNLKTLSPKIIISVLVFEEFLVQIYKRKLERNISEYEDFITIGGLATVLEVDREIARYAARLRSEYPSLRTPDAIHLASAIKGGAKVFITTDKRIPRKIDNLKVVVLL